MLGAFLTPELRDWVLLDAKSRRPFQNHFLVRQSAAVAFSQGYFQVLFKKNSKVRP